MDILDLNPFLRRKAQDGCKHLRVEVSDSEYSLTCAECRVGLDPWWYIRRSADEESAENLARIDTVNQFNDWMRKSQERANRLHEEIKQLYETKNRLQNETVSGSRLGSQVRRTRRR